MKINKLFIFAAAMLTLAGCNDEWNEDKLDGFGNFEVTDVKKLEYTLTDADYKKKAEVTIMNLVQENKENKKRLYQSIVSGIITIIAVCALIIIAAYIEMPTVIRIMLIVIAVLTAAAGISAAATLDVNAGHFQCPDCGHLFVPEMKDYVKAYHTFTKRRLTCPVCGKTGMCKHIIVR